MQYQLSLEEMKLLKMKKKERAEKEYACYNSELDLWDSTLLNKLEMEARTNPILRGL